MSSAVMNKSGILNPNAMLSVLAAAPVPTPVSQEVETTDGARAIEVAAVFDDAVLEVRHFDNPAAGRTSRLTKGLLGSAGAALLGTFALFADSYAQLAAEKAAAETATIAQPRRAEGSGRTRDAAAGGLLFYGLGALLYGLHRAGSERRENEFTIGSAPGATFKLDGDALPSPRFPLVRSTGTDYEFLFTENMTGDLTVNGKSTPLSELRGEARPAAGLEGALSLAIPEGARLSVEHQNCTFLIRSVPRPRRYPVPIRFDWRAQAYTGAVLAGAAGMLGLMFSVPPDPRSLALDNFTNEQLIRYLVKAPEVKDEAALWLKKVDAPQESSNGKAARDKSGKMGKPDAPKRTDARFAQAGPKDNPDPKMSRQMANQLAKTAGIVGLINSGAIKGMAALMGNDPALGKDAENALANLDGAAVADAWGPGGTGFVGVGPGADGTGDNTIGIGPNVLGRPFSPGGRGTPNPKLADHRAKAPEWTVGHPEVIGSLDKDVIRRVIRQHMNEVKFCYERELTRDNSLNGRVVVKFSIGGMGSVMTSVVESSTLRAGGTEQCIAGAVRRWQFPKPQGGLVIVSYPFLLKASGE